MAYEALLIQALAKGDEERVEAIKRLNTPGYYYDNGCSCLDMMNDELVALHGIRYDGSHTKSY